MAASQPKTTSPLAAAFILAVLGIALSAGAGYWGLLRHQDFSTRLVAAGIIDELVASNDSSGAVSGYRPAFKFADKDGMSHRVVVTGTTIFEGYAKGEKVGVLYPAAAPDNAVIDNLWQKWGGVLLMGGIGLLLLALAPFAAVKPPPPIGTEAVTLLPMDQRLEFHPINPETVDSYLSPPAHAAPTTVAGVTAGASAIPQGRYPVPLCELCSYMSALVYEEKTRS